MYTIVVSLKVSVFGVFGLRIIVVSTLFKVYRVGVGYDINQFKTLLRLKTV